MAVPRGKCSRDFPRGSSNDLYDVRFCIRAKDAEYINAPWNTEAWREWPPFTDGSNYVRVSTLRWKGQIKCYIHSVPLDAIAHLRLTPTAFYINHHWRWTFPSPNLSTGFTNPFLQNKPVLSTAYNYVVTFGGRKFHICIPSVTGTLKVVGTHIPILEVTVFLKFINII